MLCKTVILGNIVAMDSPKTLSEKGFLLPSTCH